MRRPRVETELNGRLIDPRLMQLYVRELNHFPRYSRGHEGKGENPCKMESCRTDTFFLIPDYVTEEGARARRRRRWKTTVRKHALRETVGPSFRRFNCFVLAVRERGEETREREREPVS